MKLLNGNKLIDVLLVDDDSELLKITREILKVEHNYEIDVATSVDVATEKMIQKNYSVIVCDIQMPKTNGFEFLKKLRESGNNVPFIVFTVTDNKETVLKSFKLGADGFVGKYGKPEVVFSTLAKRIDELTKKLNKRVEVS